VRRSLQSDIFDRIFISDVAGIQLQLLLQMMMICLRDPMVLTWAVTLKLLRKPEAAEQGVDVEQP